MADLALSTRALGLQTAWVTVRMATAIVAIRSVFGDGSGTKLSYADSLRRILGLNSKNAISRIT